MIDLHFWPTPNGYKTLILLEELGCPYTLKPVNIMRGEQRDAGFLSLNPNGRMPALVDHAPKQGDAPLTVFESGAMLQYLASKHGTFGGTTPGEMAAVSSWLHWQMAGLGPNMGQSAHFHSFASEDVPYAKTRYRGEATRLLSVLTDQLDRGAYVAGAYSIADMAIYPWLLASELAGLGDLAEYAGIRAYMDRIGARAAVQRAYAVGAPVSDGQEIDEEARRVLFGQTGEDTP